eukprot:g30789.t1
MRMQAFGYNLLALYAQPCADQDPAVYFCTRERVPKGSELFVCYGYDHPREYPWADPDIDLDTHQRQQICQRQGPHFGALAHLGWRQDLGK